MMTLTARRRLASFIASTALFACGGSSGSTTPSDGGVDAATDGGPDPAAITAACTAWAIARCERVSTCEPTTIPARYGDLSTCQAREILVCQQRLVAPGTSATPAATTTCATSISTISCSDWYAEKTSPECLAIAGAGAAGAGCAFDGQCASTFCLVGANEACGVCGTAPMVGASCATTNCGFGQTCVSATLTCELLEPTAATCSASALCAYGLACVGPSTGKTCQTAGNLGDSCDPKGVTAPLCDRTLGFTCVGTTPTAKCVAISFAAADGAACGTMSNGSYVGCTPGSSCEGATSTTTGTCQALAKDGAACDTALGPACELPARCNPTSATGTAGTCVIPTGVCGAATVTAG